MKKFILLLAVIAVFSACICKPVIGGLPEGRPVKVYIENKTFKGELLSVTPELVVVRLFEKDKDKEKETILGCQVPETEVVKVLKRCGPIGNIFAKGRKFEFKDNPLAKIQENVSDLSHDALYGSLIPDHVKEKLKIFGQDYR